MMSGFAVPGYRPGVVSLLVGGMLYEGWKKVEITRSVREMAGSFTLEVSERWAPGMNGPSTLMGFQRIREGDPCTVLYSGLPVITGYVDAYLPKYTATSHDVTIQGRSKTADLVDSSADPDVENGEMREVGVDQIARKLAAKHGIDVKVDAQLRGTFDVARVQPGETKHEMLERYARPGAVLLTDDALGNLRLLHVNGSGAFSLIEGVNIHEASATLRADNRYSDYEAKGQDHGNDQRFGREVSEITAKAKDGAIKRYRPFVVLNETKTSKQNAQDRCDWEATSRAGESTRAEVTVIDWVHDGKLWMPGDVGPLMSPMLAINRDMAIETTNLSQDESGTFARLSLTPPEALNPAAAGASGGGANAGSGGAAGSGEAPASDPAWTATKPTSGAIPWSGAAPGGTITGSR
mgnify:CR=1 FL=1